VVAPVQGELSAEIAFWSDGTPYLGEFSLTEL
jgi:hypothetical protein